MKIWRILKRIIAALVLVIVLFYVTLFLVMSYQFNREPVVDFDDTDVQFVLGWAQQEGTPSQLVNSYYPPANWAGDYEKIFVLRLQPSVVNEVVSRQGVVRGDQVTGQLKEVVHFALIFTRELAWFPAEVEIFTADYYVSPIHVVLQGEYPDAAHLIIIQPQEQTLYFVAAKM